MVLPLNFMIIYLDTETTGLRPGNICQLSYVMQDKNIITAKNFYFEVDSVEYGALAVHGLSVEKLKVLSNGKRFCDCILEIEKDFNRAGVIVCHNVSFDFMFLRTEFENCFRQFVFNESFCSMKKLTPITKLARSKGVGYKYPKLSEACEYFGITNAEIMKKAVELFGNSCGFHDARFDTAALFLCMTAAMDREKEISVLKDYL